MTHKYLFILGRNPELSKAEIRALLGSEVIVAERGNAVIVELDDALDGGFIERLGGTIAIGLVVDFDKFSYQGEKNKINYVLWNYSSRAGEFGEMLKKKFKQERVKASEKKISTLMELQSGEKVPLLSSRRLIDEEYFVFDDKSRTYFGVIVQKVDFEAIERRDMQKPVRREELAISPRLAKIMINLSKVSERGTVLDCFCGIGVVLFEALLMGLDLNVIGVDIDKKAIDGARRNLEWGGFDRDRYELIAGDSRKITLTRKANVLVTEPSLGEILRKMPTKTKAKKILREFEELMISVINNLKKNVKGRIVFSAPLIRTIAGRKGCDISKITPVVGPKLVSRFEEFRKGQVVGREIFVLET